MDEQERQKKLEAGKAKVRREGSAGWEGCRAADLDAVAGGWVRWVGEIGGGAGGLGFMGGKLARSAPFSVSNIYNSCRNYIYI